MEPARASKGLLRDRIELKRRLDGEHISDDALLVVLKYISDKAPGLGDLVGVAQDALLLLKRPEWLEILVGPRPKVSQTPASSE